MTVTSQPAPAAEACSSSESTAAPLKSPRTARFAEATTIISPIEPFDPEKSSFAKSSEQSQGKHNVSDVGFGYVNVRELGQGTSQVHLPATPLKCALKTPNSVARNFNILSPTFKEEYILDKQEKTTEKSNEKDLKIKTRVRAAKAVLRFVNFGCSLIVLSILATTLTVFNATKTLPPRNNLPPWAIGTNPWPQYLLIALASVSLFACLIVFWGYYKGGHKRAQKLAVYYSVFSVAFFVFSLIMWVVGAAVFQNAKASGNGKDLWGWSCQQNTRAQLFQNDVNYSLICRLMDWTLVCSIIEIVIEVLVILIYAVVFYRFWSKRRLRKTMDLRDKARSNLYLAQLRLQSAPNTSGFASPRFPKSPYNWPMPKYEDSFSAAEKGEYYPTQYATAQPSTNPLPTVQLQPPPARAPSTTPKPAQGMFSTPAPTQKERVNDHIGAAPGEPTYDAVPIPGAYSRLNADISLPPAAHR